MLKSYIIGDFEIMKDEIDLPDMVKICCRYRGFQCGADYIEAYRQRNVYLKGTTKRYLP